MNFKNDDTIAAIATPLGAGGIGIIRVSGKDAIAIIDPLFRTPRGRRLTQAESHRMVHGWLEMNGETMDEVLAVVMRAPHSYTREDVVEVHCHGGALAVRAVLDMACQGGARLAQPGEFTWRAFLNGRLDLTQAEAVGDIVSARSMLGLQVSANQLRGKLHGEIQALRENVTHVAALVAAGIDFPEEDVVFSHRADIQTRLRAAQERLAALLRTADQGRILREGLGIAIVGRPNVGKSSLLNALLRENRAIVTEIPGTTRDTLEESLVLQGLAVRLIDTAGIRETADVVEQEGIRRSERAIGLADLALAVLDGAAPLEAADRQVLKLVSPAATLVVINKQDRIKDPLPPWVSEIAPLPHVVVSAQTGTGLAELEQKVVAWALRGDRPHLEDAMITNLRQREAARHAEAALADTLRGIGEGQGDELLAVDLSRVLDALGDIVGETTADDLLNRIFSEFCIGK
jgi:tRNA modification GTPase